MKVAVRLRKGDWAWLALGAGVAVYEKLIEDDADLLSNRAAAYKRSAPLLTYAVVWVTAMHLTEDLDPRWDPYHLLVRYFRRAAAPQPDA